MSLKTVLSGIQTEPTLSAKAHEEMKIVKI